MDTHDLVDSSSSKIATPSVRDVIQWWVSNKWSTTFQETTCSTIICCQILGIQAVGKRFSMVRMWWQLPRCIRHPHEHWHWILAESYWKPLFAMYLLNYIVPEVPKLSNLSLQTEKLGLSIISNLVEITYYTLQTPEDALQPAGKWYKLL